MGFSKKTYTKEELLPFFDRTRSRGPDMSQILETPSGWLCFHRLAIMGLTEAGMQPFELDGDYVVCNGEIYGFRPLKRQLTEKGYSFRSGSDCEILLPLYREYGLEMFAKLDAEFALIIYDSKRDDLIAARDPIGIRPLYYGYDRSGAIVFASEPKNLVGLCKGIRPFPPGHYYADGKFVRYADLTTVTQYSPDDLETVCRNIRNKLIAAVDKRLDADAPLGFLLSGGLDSSCMVTELCGQMSDPAQLHTFTTSYPGDASCDEWYFADLVNRACGCTGNQILPAPTDIEGQFENVVWHTEGLCGLSLLGVKALLEQVRSQGYKVVLNGQCGDELMLGYERYYAFYFSWLLKTGRIRRLLREFPQAGRHSRLHLHSLAAYVLYFDLPIVRDTRQLHRAERFVKRDLLEMRKKAQLHELLYPRSLEQLQYLELTATQLPNIVRMDDRLFMSASLESRIPFMDYQFVELACRIPPEYKIREGYTKYLMRCVFDARMPREVTWRTNKLGFGAPVDAWARQVSLEYLLSLIRNARTAPYFWQDALEALALRSPVHPAVFEFLTMESFARQFDVSV